MEDEELIAHLEGEHEASLAGLRWPYEPDRARLGLGRRLMAGRRVWASYHFLLHSASFVTVEAGHIHEEDEMREWKGQSLLDGMWEELMTIGDRLMTGQEAEDGQDKGRAEGVAYCIALVQKPYAPDIQAVRAEFVERWRDAQEG